MSRPNPFAKSPRSLASFNRNPPTVFAPAATLFEIQLAPSHTLPPVHFAASHASEAQPPAILRPPHMSRPNPFTKFPRSLTSFTRDPPTPFKALNGPLSATVF